MNSYHHLNKIIVDTKAIVHNYKQIKSRHPESEVCPVVKSNAYGHGLAQLASVLDSLAAPFLIVNSLDEALLLKRHNVKTRVLILGFTHKNNLRVIKLPFSYAIYDLELARALNKSQPGSKLHIFVDTGMNREGVQLSHLSDFVKEIKKLKNLEIEGVCSHFADADNSSDDGTRMQIRNFKDAIRILNSHGINPKWRHISASAGSFKVRDFEFNMIRSGKAVFGINPLRKSDKFYDAIKLKPALKLESTVVQLKNIKKGDKVGYGFTFEAQRNLKSAVLSAGYFEGVDRRLSNKGYVKVDNIYCPIIGRISMNMTIIDASGVRELKVGHKAVVYSDNQADKNSIYNSAILCGTIPYDLLAGIPQSVHRDLV